jgi:5-formyltetrahydrofolate cyclo-ligase
MRAARAAISPGERVRLGERVEGRLLSLPEVVGARTVLIFYSFGSEVPTAGLAAHLAASGKRVLLPYLHEGTMAAAEFLPGREGSLVRAGYGPKEPAERRAVPPTEVDVVVVPGLAFDRTGHRIGYGGGFYDRYLAAAPPGATRVGIAFHAQVLPSVPHGLEDEPVDIVVTEREVIACPARPGRPQGTGP